MTPEEVIDTCAAMGIYLRVHAGKLKAAPAPAGPLLDNLRLHRDAIIARLEGLPPMPPMGAPHRRGPSPQNEVCAREGRLRANGTEPAGTIGGIGFDVRHPAASAPPMPPMTPVPFFPAAKAAPPHAHSRTQVDVTRLSNRIGGIGRQSELVADPTDLAERAAILETDGVCRREAETHALREFGFTSWEAYAAALATHLKGKCLPPAHWCATGRPSFDTL
jgi:hypothetical protein